jgi:hypothetical protein
VAVPTRQDTRRVLVDPGDDNWALLGVNLAIRFQ